MKTYETHLQEFLSLLEKGDLEGARRYAIDNIASFPEAVQGEILTALANEGLANAARIETEIAKMQKEGIETLDGLEQLQKKINEGVQK